MSFRNLAMPVLFPLVLIFKLKSNSENLSSVDWSSRGKECSGPSCSKLTMSLVNVSLNL